MTRHAALAVVILAAGCSADLPSTTPGKILGEWPPGHPALRVVYGRHWAVGGGMPLSGTVRIAGLDSAIDLAPPDPFDATVTVPPEPTGEGLRLHISAPPVDRLLIWAGTVNHSSGEIAKTYWTSEDVSFPFLEERGGMAALILKSALRLCSRGANCELVVQLLKYWSTSDPRLVSVTEHRSTVAFRGHP